LVRGGPRTEALGVLRVVLVHSLGPLARHPCHVPGVNPVNLSLRERILSGRRVLPDWLLPTHDPLTLEALPHSFNSRRCSRLSFFG
jgi:hypothetical protein